MLVLWACMSTIGICALYWVLGAQRFADFAQYVDLSGEQANDPTFWPWYGPEGVSRGILHFASNVYGSPRNGVLAIALLTQMMMVSIVLWVSSMRRVRAENLVLTVGLFAPLLSLITLRNSPAYVLCAFAIGAARWADRPRHRLVLAAGILSLLFHLSAVYVIVGSLIATAIPARVNRQALYFSGLLAGLFGLFVRRAVDVDALRSLLPSVLGPVGALLSQRLVYLSGTADAVGLLHVIYFVFMSAVVYRLVLREPAHYSDRLILSFFLLYCVLLISPVAAIRSSHFMAVPLILTARRPFADLKEGTITHIIYVVANSALLMSSVFSVFFWA